MARQLSTGAFVRGFVVSRAELLEDLASLLDDEHPLTRDERDTIVGWLDARVTDAQLLAWCQELDDLETLLLEEQITHDELSTQQADAGERFITNLGFLPRDDDN